MLWLQYEEKNTYDKDEVYAFCQVWARIWTKKKNDKNYIKMFKYISKWDWKKKLNIVLKCVLLLAYLNIFDLFYEYLMT